MSIMDRIPLSNMRCLQRAPDGSACRYRTNDLLTIERHELDHERCEKGVEYDNCAVCLYPIKLTRAAVLRVHGPVSARCDGSGKVGRFVLRCRGELTD